MNFITSTQLNDDKIVEQIYINRTFPFYKDTYVIFYHIECVVVVVEMAKDLFYIVIVSIYIVVHIYTQFDIVLCWEVVIKTIHVVYMVLVMYQINPNRNQIVYIHTYIHQMDSKFRFMWSSHNQYLYIFSLLDK